MGDLRDVRQHHAALTEIARRFGRIKREDCRVESICTPPEITWMSEAGEKFALPSIVREAPDHGVRDRAGALRVARVYAAEIVAADALLRVVVTRFYRG